MKNIDGYTVVDMQSVVDALDYAIRIIETAPSFNAELRNVQSARDSFARMGTTLPKSMLN